MASCPSCRAELIRDSGSPGVSYVCPSCRGHVYGLAPFERLLTEGTGARIWAASRDGAPAGACPFCSRPMQQPPAGQDAPEGLAMCHLCQEVWVPDAAASWMASNGAGPAPAGPADRAHPSECVNCGAPFIPDDMGRCRYCRTQIAAPRPVVVELHPDPPAGDGVLRLAGGLGLFGS